MLKKWKLRLLIDLWFWWTSYEEGERLRGTPACNTVTDALMEAYGTL